MVYLPFLRIAKPFLLIHKQATDFLLDSIPDLFAYTGSTRLQNPLRAMARTAQKSRARRFRNRKYGQ